MVLLNRKIDYSLLILCYLFHKRAGSSCREIAQHYRISRPFVANILKELCQKNYVSSQRGVKGGYVLLDNIPQKTLADLIDTLDDTFRLAECNHHPAEECCELATSCPIRGPIEEVNLRLREVLAKVTLAEIFHKHEVNMNDVLLDVSRCTKI